MSNIGGDIVTFIEFIYAIIAILLITICILVSFFVVYKSISRNKKRIKELSFEELIQIVNIITNNEISLYERNIFNNGGKILDKASYDNYYKDILENIFKAISDDMIACITEYIDKESFYSMISREVLIYLNSKIL